MRAGRLRHRLNLQESTETRNAHGEAIITWATSYTVWGAVEPLSGSEAVAGLTGLLEGNIQASGDSTSIAAGGNLKLVGGMFQGIKIHQASAKFSAARDKVRDLLHAIRVPATRREAGQ